MPKNVSFRRVKPRFLEKKKNRPCGVLIDSLEVRLKNISVIFFHLIPFPLKMDFYCRFALPVQKQRADIFLRQTEKSFLNKNAVIQKICPYFFGRDEWFL
jgi:hypothetical protein